MERIRRIFFIGLLLLVPLLISLAVLVWAAGFLDSVLGTLLHRAMGPRYIPGMGLVLLLVLIMVAGYVSEIYLGKKLFSATSRWLERIPIFNKIYTPVKEISDTLFGRKKQQFFQAAVIVPFQGAEAMGFVVPLPAEAGLDKVGVFVPTPPNIGNGFYLIYPREQVRFLTMSVEEAVRTVISLGTAVTEAPSDGTEKP